MRRLVIGFLGAAVVVAASSVGTPESAVRATPFAERSALSSNLSARARGLHVVGNRLRDRNGRLVQLHGVNRSGTEYACVQGWGIFDGPSSAASIKTIASWHVNAVRIPLNEDCWLGIKGVKAEYGGARYRRAIVDYVRTLHVYGLYAELSLMWAAPGSYKASYQPGAPDKDHSPAMWASLARTFKNDPNVVLAPWGETIVDADCFLRGGVCQATYGPANTPYPTAGMQEAVTVMRRAGYRGVISIPGLDYANNLSKWLSAHPSRPASATDRGGARVREEQVLLDRLLQRHVRAGRATRAVDLRRDRGDIRRLRMRLKPHRVVSQMGGEPPRRLLHVGVEHVGQLQLPDQRLRVSEAIQPVRELGEESLCPHAGGSGSVAGAAANRLRPGTRRTTLSTPDLIRPTSSTVKRRTAAASTTNVTVPATRDGSVPIVDLLT